MVGAETGSDGSIGDLVDRLIGDEVDPAHYRILSVASLARVTTPELLDDVLGDADPQDSYKWLATRSFSEPLAAGVTLHSLVADAVRERIRANDPIGEAALRRSIADHLHRRAVAGQHGLSTELQHLVVDPNVRWGFASDVGNRYRIDRIRDGDAERIGSILEAIGVSEWWAITKVFFTDHPECCGVARDASGHVGGYFIAVSPASAPRAAERRPAARSVAALRPRRARNHERRPVARSGRPHRRDGRGHVAARCRRPARDRCRQSAIRVPADLPAGAGRAGSSARRSVPCTCRRSTCTATAWSSPATSSTSARAGLIGFQRDWIYRETGSAVPVDRPDGDPSRLLRMLREPAGLSHGPAWLGDTPAERLANLRRRVTAALDVFGTHHDDQLARAIIEAAFLGEAASHEAIARQLHLSRSAYFRRLNAATDACRRGGRRPPRGVRLSRH